MTAVILAAGLSKRFGGKKLLIKINNKPMVKHVADLVCIKQFEEKILVYSDEEVAKVVSKNCDKDNNFTYVYNKMAEHGLSTSLRAALEISRATDGYIFFVADQPFIDEDTVNKLLKAFYDMKGSIIVPTYGGRRGNPVIFSNKWFEQLKNIKGDSGGREIIRENPHEVWEVEIENLQIGIDIDTQEVYEKFSLK